MSFRQSPARHCRNGNGDSRHRAEVADKTFQRRRVIGRCTGDYIPADRKVVSLAQLLKLRCPHRAAQKNVVHCHGCFDIVHPGHIHHLQFARSLGDVLIVSVSADTHVNKGVDRPLIPDDLRAASLAALECVDCGLRQPRPDGRRAAGSAAAGRVREGPRVRAEPRPALPRRARRGRRDTAGGSSSPAATSFTPPPP